MLARRAPARCARGSRASSAAATGVRSRRAETEGREGIAVSVVAAEPTVGRAYPPRLIIGVLALAAFAAAAAAFNLSLAGEYGRNPYVHASLVAWITLSYVLCGLTAWWRRPASWFGPLMVVAGFSPLLSRLEHADVGFLQVVGEGLLLLPPVLFLHVFLAYPSGRLDRRPEQVLVLAGYTAIFGLDLARVVIEVTDRSGVAGSVVLGVQRTAIIAIAVGAVVVLVRRRQSTGRSTRGSLGLLVISFGLALGAVAVGIGMLLLHVPGADVVRWVAFGLIGVAPVLLLLGFLRAGLARLALGELFLELSRDPRPSELQVALSRALRDPSLTLAYWVPQFRSFADVEGRQVELPSPESARVVTMLDRGGAPVAALVHDPSLEDERELLDAVTAAASIAIENAQLHVELRARLEELRGSRSRILEAARKERQRLERNLHDGAQQRLVALALELSLLEERLAGDAEAAAQVDQARHEVAASLDELRELAHGIHPAVVSGHGLAVALEQLAARAPVPVEMRVEIAKRLPEALEVAAYYVVSESLANIAKHAQAESARIDVVQSGDDLVLEIVDDGVGGADSERGSGLRGLADRVEALNGRLRVWTPLGGGTRVRAEIPCV